MTRSKKIATLGLIALVSIAFMGCSDDSNPVVAPTTAVDTAPPAVPWDLEAALNGDSAVVTWAMNTSDSDLAGFLVQKAHYDDAIVTLVGTPALVTSFVDNNVLPGINEYRVLAVDESGNESAYATIQVANSTGKTDLRFEE